VIVRKYGGSSLASVDRIREVARQIVAARKQGYAVVVVVSAMGRTTDELAHLARQVSPRPPRRELDMLLSVGERISMSLLSMALRDLDCPAISYTGSQCGLITDESHTAAEIVEVRPDRVRRSLAEGKVVVVAGFQGVSRSREITTLGRGGSDATAVALAAALGAQRCEILKDVDGVFTADPHRLPDALRYETLTYDDLEALTTAGSEVVHPRAVAYARRHGVPLLVASSFRSSPGSQIGPETRTRLVAPQRPEPLDLTGGPLGVVVTEGCALLDLSTADGGTRDDWQRQLRLAAPFARPVSEGGAWDGGRFRWWLIGPDEPLAALAGRLPRPDDDSTASLLFRRGLTCVTLAGRSPHHWPGLLAHVDRKLAGWGIDDWFCRADGIGLRFLLPPAAADRLAAHLHETFLVPAIDD